MLEGGEGDSSGGFGGPGTGFGGEVLLFGKGVEGCICEKGVGGGVQGGVTVVVIEVDHGVILEVGTYSREIDEGGDVERGEDGWVADTRYFQEGGGVDCACGEDDGARREDRLRWRAWVACKFDTGGV